jgi:hypothetical protein
MLGRWTERPAPLGLRVLRGQTQRRVWGAPKKRYSTNEMEGTFELSFSLVKAEAAEKGWHGSVGGHSDSALMVRFCGWVA